VGSGSGVPERIVFTLGHSTRRASQIVSLLRAAGSRALIDIRRWPTSRRNPEASKGFLEETLRGSGILYIHLPALGGYRAWGADAPLSLRREFTCYSSEGFNAYAAYLASSSAARRALEVVAYLAEAGAKPTLLCSERLPWRCHRKIVAEWLSLRGFKVVHIIDVGVAVEHRPGRCRALAGGSGVQERSGVD
jgi:uncharacterized protein (DUF488 family)